MHRKLLQALVYSTTLKDSMEENSIIAYQRSQLLVTSLFSPEHDNFQAGTDRQSVFIIPVGTESLSIFIHSVGDILY